MIDTYEAVNRLVRSISGVTTLTTAIYTYPPGLPSSFAGDSDAVLIIPDGAGQADTLPIQYERVQVRCYGSTFASARSLALAVANGLHRLQSVDLTMASGEVVRLYDSRLLSGPTWMQEFETTWRYVMLTFAMQWTDREVEDEED